MEFQQSSLDLLAIAKDALEDSADPTIFTEAYLPDGSTIPDFPKKAQKYVTEAREKFFRSGENEFHVDIDLGNSHKFESRKSITAEVINQIRPIFAQEYLKYIGMTNSSAAINMAQTLLPLTPNHFEIHTRKKGYNSEQLIVYQNPKVYAKPSETRKSMCKKCKTIRADLKTAWKQIDNQFPTEKRKTLPAPYLPDPQFDSIRFTPQPIEKKIRCPTTIPQEKSKYYKKPVPSPFIGQFSLVLPRAEIEKIMLSFIDTFDFLNYLQGGMKSANDCIEFLQSGVCPRLLFHVAKYIHSILIFNSDDLPDFIRARALWHIIYQKIDDSILAFRFVSVALMMMKSCTFVLFQQHSNPGCFSDIDVAQSSIYHSIDRLLNPFMVFDSLEKEEDFRAKTIPMILGDGKRLLDDILQLISNAALPPKEERIAKWMTNPQGTNNLLCILGSESWGDPAEFTGVVETRHRYNETRIVQKRIAMDIAKFNETMSRTPPSWIRTNEQIESIKARTPRSIKVKKRKKTTC